MDFSVILNIILGGGLTGCVVAIFTLRATVRKAQADAVKAEAEAETVRMDNAEHATRILMDNIVEPLKQELRENREELRATKDELGGTRKDLQSTKREMARLRKALDTANRCEHRDDCPVLSELRDPAKARDVNGGEADRNAGQRCAGGSAGKDGTDTDVGGEDDASDG